MSSPRYCEGCGREASSDARFCAGCGRGLASVAAGTGAAPSGDGSPGADEARATSAPGAGPGEREVMTFGPLAVQGVGELLLCVLTVGLVWLWLLAVRRRDRYRLTTERLEMRSGLVSVTNRTVELFRVRDLEVREPLFLRMRGAGDLVVRSQDTGEPEVVLAAIPRVREVHETLRGLVNSERRRTHVRMVEDS